MLYILNKLYVCIHRGKAVKKQKLKEVTVCAVVTGLPTGGGPLKQCYTTITYNSALYTQNANIPS